jgi:hypothetical protein
LLIDSIPAFEFPRQSLNYKVEKENAFFTSDLTNEEINILALLMKTFACWSRSFPSPW